LIAAGLLTLIQSREPRAIDDAGPAFEFADGRRHHRITIGEVNAVASQQANAPAVTPRDDPVAVMLDLLQPTVPERGRSA